MPRSTPLSSEEKAVGQRLASIRKELLIPRTSCALKLNISTDRLISYEFGRAKLPWEIGKQFCEVFRANPIWIATGLAERWEPFLLLLQRDENEVISILAGTRPSFSLVVNLLYLPFWRNLVSGEPLPKAVEEAAYGLANQVDPDRSADFKWPPPRGPFLNEIQQNKLAKFTETVLRPIFAEIRPTNLDAFVKKLTQVTNHCGREANGSRSDSPS